MLTDELARQGDWLFRRRSYAPLVLLPFAVWALYAYRQPWTDSLLLRRACELGCLLVSLLGVAARALALGWAGPGSSGRNTREQIADHLNVTGIYSVCRHPLYLGNILMMLGVLLFTRSLLLALAGLLWYVLLYERIIAAEERFLEQRFGENFRQWAAGRPALIPKWSLWVKPPSPFSWRAAVKGEFYGITALLLALLVLRTLDIRFSEGIWRADIFWMVPSAAMLALFVVLRHVRKHTRFFEEPAPGDQSLS
jgi:protein-S-isoprenylcysteine O-methyltransferase Ste14